MRTVEVSVTAEHITHGQKRSCKNCPIALAVGDAVPQAADIEVARWISLLLPGHAWSSLELPIEAQDFIFDFDHGEPVEPFTFTMQIPGEVLS